MQPLLIVVLTVLAEVLLVVGILKAMGHLEQCPSCGSRITFVGKGVIPCFSLTNTTEYEEVVDIECYACKERSRLRVI